jgi:hypothetical protein
MLAIAHRQGRVPNELASLTCAVNVICLEAEKKIMQMGRAILLSWTLHSISSRV